MKQMAIGVLVIAVAALGVAVYLNREVSKEPGFMLGFAVGNPQSGQLELHIVVQGIMIRKQGPRLASNSAAPLWDEWIDQHFHLRDAAGNTLPLRKDGWSKLIDDRAAMNPEFFLKGTLQAGDSYTLEYQPYREERKVYRYQFTVPADGMPFSRPNFEPTEG